jgi:hypothetical protein
LRRATAAPRNFFQPARLPPRNNPRRQSMTFGRGLLLWLVGIPLPIILLLALFWR